LSGTVNGTLAIGPASCATSQNPYNDSYSGTLNGIGYGLSAGTGGGGSFFTLTPGGQHYMSSGIGTVAQSGYKPGVGGTVHIDFGTIVVDATLSCTNRVITAPAT